VRRSVLDEIESQIREGDEGTRRARAERLAELALLGVPRGGRMIPSESAYALNEAQTSYINGEFLCTVLVVQTCLEKLLSGFMDSSLDPSAWTPSRESYPALLARARRLGLLSEWEEGLFARLSRNRNPIAHYRKAAHSETLFWRARAAGSNEARVLREDARAAIRALIGLVNRDPFALGPLKVAFDEGELSVGVHPYQFRLFEPQDGPAARVDVTASEPLELPGPPSLPPPQIPR
jgi:hypothetical protein